MESEVAGGWPAQWAQRHGVARLLRLRGRPRRPWWPPPAAVRTPPGKHQQRPLHLPPPPACNPPTPHPPASTARLTPPTHRPHPPALTRTPLPPSPCRASWRAPSATRCSRTCRCRMRRRRSCKNAGRWGRAFSGEAGAEFCLTRVRGRVGGCMHAWVAGVRALPLERWRNRGRRK